MWRLKSYRLHSFAIFLLLGLVPGSAAADPYELFPPTAQVQPQPIMANEQLTVQVETGANYCIYILGSTNVTRLESQVIVDYAVVFPSSPEEGVICAPSLPRIDLTFVEDLGELSSGQYELVLNGTYDGVDADPVVIPFGVLPAAVSVPAGRWIVPGMGFVLLLVGWRRLRNS